MLKRIAALLLLVMLLTGTALSDPLLVSENETAWLGENNYLYVKDAAGVIRQLPSPIADLVGMDEANIYCLTTGRRLYAVRLDGSASSSLLTSPTEEQLRQYRQALPMALEDETLYLVDQSGARNQVASGVAAAGCSDSVLFYVVREAEGRYRLYSLPLIQDSMTLTPVILEPVEVPEPLSLTVSKEAVALLNADRSVTLLSLAGQELMRAPAAAEDTAAAVFTNGKLFQYRLTADGQWQLISAATMEFPSIRQAVQPVVTPQPTPVVVTAPPRSSTVVVTAVPTARPTARPTATPAPEDNTIRKWDRGTRVKKMQQRLSDLGYPVGKVDGTFGNNTEIAVNLFQSAVGAAEHSYMTEKVQRKLYAADAPVYDPYLDLKKGDKGIRVKQMQEALKTRGYDPGKIDGIYGTKTIQAVAAYQQSLGMALAPNEKPGEIASRWLLLNLYTDLPVNPPRPTNPTNPTSPTNLTPTAQPVNPQPVNPTVPPVIPPATQTDLASPSNL